MSVIKMSDLALANQRVLIREDLNVPVKDGKITSDARLKAALPTLKLALESGAKVMVMSHLGRPTEGEFNAEFSLQPVVDYLAASLNYPVRLVTEYLDGVEVGAGELVVFENILANSHQAIGEKSGSITISFLQDNDEV